MHNGVKRGGLANALSLHYFDDDLIDAEGCFNFIEQWILNHGLTPTKMGGKGDKNITFSRGKKSLERTHFQGIKEQGIWVAALPPEETIGTEGVDFLMSAWINFRGCSKKSFCVFCWDDHLIPWENNYIKALVEDLCQFLNPQYGYAFQREFKKGPSYYTGGTLMGIDSFGQEAQQITNWGITGLADEDDPDYQPHMIRDVYPLNFLSPQHLNAPIGSQTLQHWILADPSHGTLEELLPNFWSWAVDPHHIEDLKTALKPHNLLIAHMTF